MALNRPKIRETLERDFDGKSKKEMEEVIARFSKTKVTALAKQVKDAYPASGGRKPYFVTLQQVVEKQVSGGGKPSYNNHNNRNIQTEQGDEGVEVDWSIEEAQRTIASLSAKDRQGDDAKLLIAATRSAQEALMDGDALIRVKVKLTRAIPVKPLGNAPPSKEENAASPVLPSSATQEQNIQAVARASEKAQAESNARALLNHCLGGGRDVTVVGLHNGPTLNLLRRLFRPAAATLGECPVKNPVFFRVWSKLLKLYDEPATQMDRMRRVPVMEAVRWLLDNPAQKLTNYVEGLSPFANRPTSKGVYNLMMVGVYVAIAIEELMEENAPDDEWAAGLELNVLQALQAGYVLQEARTINAITRHTLNELPTAERIATQRRQMLDAEVWSILDGWSPKTTGKRRGREDREEEVETVAARSVGQSPSGSNKSRSNSTSKGRSSKSSARPQRASNPWHSWDRLEEAEQKARATHAAQYKKDHPEWEGAVPSVHKLAEPFRCRWCNGKGHKAEACAPRKSAPSTMV